LVVAKIGRWNEIRRPLKKNGLLSFSTLKKSQAYNKPSNFKPSNSKLQTLFMLVKKILSIQRIGICCRYYEQVHQQQI